MIPHVERAVERRAMRRWMFFIGAFFVFEFVLWGTAIYVVHDDPSHAVVEAYDEKALAWDEHRLALAASKALGWASQVTLDPTGGRVRVRLLDRHGRPVAGARLSARVYHRARAGRSQVVTLTETTPGDYGAAVRLGRPGRWVVELAAERGADRYVETADLWIEGGARP